MVIFLRNKYSVCPGCSLLCDDIEIEMKGTEIDKANNACIKGVSRIKDTKKLESKIDGNEVNQDEAIFKAAELLQNANNPLIFGLDNSTTEAQLEAIKLAKLISATIDDNSSFCQGPIVNAILKNELKTCTLDDVRDYADVLVFWGADPSNSHPRLNSKYAYYPRGKERQRGWDEDRTAIAIDVRESSSSVLCKDNFYQIPPRSDGELMTALSSAFSGKMPKVSFDIETQRILKLSNILKKAKYGVIFACLGLTYSQTGIETIKNFLTELNTYSNFHLIPMVGHYNMRGFNQALYNETGYVNRVKFVKNESGNLDIKHGLQYSVLEQLNNKEPDTVLIIGTDPFTSMPHSVAKKLKEVPTIIIDPCETLTEKIADVVIRSAKSGIECGGNAIRIDGTCVELVPIINSGCLCDEHIICKIMEEI